MKKIIIGSVLIVGLATGLAFAQGKNFGQGGYGHNKRCNGYQMNVGMESPGMNSQGMNRLGMDRSGMQGPRMKKGYAQGGGRGYGDCQASGWAGQGYKNSEDRQKFFTATVEQRKQMHAKRFELREIYRNGGGDVEKIAEIEKEMIDLRTQIQKKAQELRADAK